MKNPSFLLTACAPVLSLLCSCAARSAEPLAARDLDGSWSIVKVRSTDTGATTTEEDPYIDFDYARKNISGNSGCNRMMGAFAVDTLTRGTLTFGPIATTRMACPDMALENDILEALAEVTSYKTVSKTDAGPDTPLQIALCGAHGEQLLLLQRIPSDASTDPKVLEGSWSIRTVNGSAIEKVETVPYLKFDLAEKRLSGNASCNTINCSFEASRQGELSLSPMISTLMMCAEMETETAILQALGKVASFRIAEDKNHLSLRDNSGDELLGLERNPSLGK